METFVQPKITGYRQFRSAQSGLRGADGDALAKSSDAGILRPRDESARRRSMPATDGGRVSGVSEIYGSGAMTAGDPVMRCAALFVQQDGCYMGLCDVDAWPESRDARRYSGHLPVVAHPPCQLWGAMANVNYARWGGEHNKPGNDGGCFSSALANVRRCGGVLEHPAKTRAWAAHGLDKPVGVGWKRAVDGGWVCEVWQSAYGHRANKATWLYYHGTNHPFDLRWGRQAGTHQIGFHDQRGKDANKPTLGKKEANATPFAFRDELMLLAMTAHSALQAQTYKGAR